MKEIALNFKRDDSALNMSGSAFFRDSVSLGVSSVSVKGLADWRHVGANVIQIKKETLQSLKVPNAAAKLAKVGIIWQGIKSKSDILLPYNLRKGRNGRLKTKILLEKFFKSLGAYSVRFIDDEKC